jgi:hypothetical protein
MKNSSFIILKKLEKNGEMKLCDIAKLLPAKYNDHRDFHPLASLITQGLVEDSLVENNTLDKNPDYKNLKTQVLAWKLFATSTAEYKAEYNGHSWFIGGKGEYLKDQLYSLTGYGHLFLEDTRNKERDKRFTFLIAIFSAIFASSLTYYLGKFN